MARKSSKSDEHRCEWRETHEQLVATLAEMQLKLDALAAQHEALKRLQFGKKSERGPRAKLPPAVQPSTPSPEAVQKKRAEAREGQRNALPAIEEFVTLDRSACPLCADTLEPAGKSEPTETIEYVCGHFRRRVTRCETKACACGYIEQAKGPARFGDRGRYAPSFAAHIVTAKCADSTPIHRIEKQLARQGVPVARSTMTDIFLRASELLEPVYKAMVAKVPEADVVHADESHFRQQDKEGRVYFWTFATRENTVYSYAGTRSGTVAQAVLGDSKGTLVVDAYTGYNRVTAANGRTRAGCFAHVRRKFYETLAHAESKRAYELIGQLYAIEADARNRAILGTQEHAELRRMKSAPIVETLFRDAHAWQNAIDPRSDLGRAIGYLVNNEAPLRVFLDDPAVPIDNNTAEQKMRRVALGRNNFLFAGSANGGKALAILYSLVATCEQHRINPQAYLEAAFAEAISVDNATEWLPTVWFDRVRTKADIEHPPRDPVTNQPADDVT